MYNLILKHRYAERKIKWQIRNIRELGEPCLRKICKPVKEVNLRTKILIGEICLIQCMRLTE